MKKAIIIVFAVALGIVLLWIILRATHIFETYTTPTNSNTPTYKEGSVVMASRLKKPDYGSFICFKQPNGVIWVFRCIAKGGDVVEIRDTKVYLNNKLLNEPYTNNEYNISESQLDQIRGYVEQYNYHVRPLGDKQYIITMTEAEEKSYKLNLKPYIVTKGVSEPNTFGDFKEMKYNQDNLGPMKVPEDSYFVLGDNRHSAFDSRFIGFIKKSDIISTVIN